MTRGPRAVVAAVLLAAAVALVVTRAGHVCGRDGARGAGAAAHAARGAVAGVLVAADAPTDAPSDSPRAASKPEPAKPSKPPKVGAKGSTSAEDLMWRMLKNPLSATALVLTKFVAGIAGLVLAILALVRRSKVKRGLLPPPRASSPSRAPFGLAAIALFAVAIAASDIVRLLAARAGWLHPDADGVLPLVEALLVQTAALVPPSIITVAAIRYQRALDGRSAWGVRPTIRLALGTFLVSCAVVLGVGLAWGLLLKLVFDVNPAPQDLVLRIAEPGAALEAALVAIYGIVLAPFAEECLFRGLLYACLRDLTAPASARLAAAARATASETGGAAPSESRRALLRVGATALGPGLAMVVSAALFAGVHNDLTAALPLFSLALLLAWTYERTGTLVAPMLVHALNNATSLLPIFLLRV